jgi:hypothetical protein
MPVRIADVAQLVEQLIRNQQVIGSSPIVGSICFQPLEFLPKNLDTVGSEGGQFTTPKNNLDQALGTTNTVMDSAGKVVDRVLVVPVTVGAVTVRLGWAAMAFRFALL